MGNITETNLLVKHCCDAPFLYPTECTNGTRTSLLWKFILNLFSSPSGPLRPLCSEHVESKCPCNCTHRPNWKIPLKSASTKNCLDLQFIKSRGLCRLVESLLVMHKANILIRRLHPVKTFYHILSWFTSGKHMHFSSTCYFACITWLLAD